MLITDPLKIYYFVVLASDAPTDTTVFQGFSNSWWHLTWALQLLTTAPADVLESSYPIDLVNLQRLGDLRPLSWLPINAGAIESISAGDVPPFTVCFSGEADAAARVAAWMKTHSAPVLHVSSVEVPDACRPDEFTLEGLHLYCIKALEHHAKTLSPDRLDAARSSLSNWSEPEFSPAGLKEYLHNITLPNHMSLRRAARSIEEGEAFIGRSEAEYTTVILESIKAVLALRMRIGIGEIHRMTLLSPPLILTEPAFFRHAYRRIKPEGPFKQKAVARAHRLIQTQKGLCVQVDADFAADLDQSQEAVSLIAERARELEIMSLAVGLKAAQTCSAVMRLSPAVNHVFAALTSYAANVRSGRFEARLKSKRLFDKIQNELKTAIGDDRLNFIMEDGGPLKLICDAPIEWLPLGNLPLSMRYDCSRINATPGNLLIQQLTGTPAVTFTPAALQKILIISSFTDKDPLKNILTGALDAIRGQWDGKTEIVFKTASTESEFAEALNSFDGQILIFDGHGVDNADEPIGQLVIGTNHIDVWQLRGTVRIPPIVILSACDTHGIDASSHATVGNGFLALGARTVLATLLPVGGRSSASFIGRLIYRIADFLPAMLRAEKRVLNWMEVVSGMLRMLLASEMLDHLVGPPSATETPRGQIQHSANIEINIGDLDWYDNLLNRIAEHRKETRERVDSRAGAVLARSEAIRYIQLGNPETILIDDGSIASAVLAQYGQGAEPERQELAEKAKQHR
ncbi:CHAT domain-containing protein [Bradyrhizobium sp. SZCCHNS3051]|uniref:CHAT domain-containing protein n=1 Tax=Bradyrhizobium sp. SZCCHNS3051 TaxID=3057320 RepID=UPI0029160479|nr:CHAT domain-containing protein [Bradyrhizobium sp. SZCCHNS3051]